MLLRATVAVEGKWIGLWAPSVGFSVCEVFVGFTFKDKAAASTSFGSGVVGPGMQKWDSLGQSFAQPLPVECAGFSLRSHLSRGVLGLELEPRRCPRSVGCQRWELRLGRTGVAKGGNGPGGGRAEPSPGRGRGCHSLFPM